QAAHEASVAGQGLEQGAGRAIPEPDGLVPAPRSHAPAVRGKGDRIHEIDMPAKLMDDRPAWAREFADVDDIAAGQRKLAAVGRERHAEHTTRSTGKRHALCVAGRGIPEPCVADVRVIIEPSAAGGDRATIGGIGQVEDGDAALGDLPRLFSAFPIEDSEYGA